MFSCPLSVFLHTDGHMHKDITYGEYPFRLHFFNVTDSGTGRGFLVWGMTAGMLIRIAEIAYGCSADFEAQMPDCPGRTAVILSQLRSSKPPPTRTQLLAKL